MVHSDVRSVSFVHTCITNIIVDLLSARGPVGSAATVGNTQTVPDAQLIQALKAQIAILSNIGTLSAATKQALTSANDKLKNAVKLDAALTVAKEVATAIGKDKNAQVPANVKTAFEQTMNGIQSAVKQQPNTTAKPTSKPKNGGNTLKGQILFCGITLTFFSLFH